MNVTLTLTSDQVREIAQTVADLLRGDVSSAAAPELITLDEAAALAAVKRETVANWLYRGRLARHGVPRKPLVSRHEVLALVESPRRSSAIRSPARKPPIEGRFGALARKRG